MITIITDAGRSTSSHPNERNDCTVRTIATLKSISYDESHVFMARLGRPPKKGPCGKTFWKKSACAIAGSRQIARSGTLGKFVKRFPMGRYMIGIRRGCHVFSVIDGVAYDCCKQGDKTRIAFAWRIA